MPSIDGGDQNSREYSPHLYNDAGEYVGNPLAEMMREKLYGVKVKSPGEVLTNMQQLEIQDK